MLKQFLKYIAFLIKAKSVRGHGIHSPFVFDLLTNIIADKTPFYVYQKIENLRKRLKKSKKVITVTDYGAGSKVNSSGRRKVGDIARHSLISKKDGQLLFRLVHHFKPKVVLELGTSLGISTLYLATPDSRAKVVSMEGCPEIAAIAESNFDHFNLKNIELVRGNFDATLPETLKQVKQLDFVYFDGNHRKIPTLNYFQQCLEKAHSDSVFIFDDIHWSGEMEDAWEKIKKHPKVTVTIDLFFKGLVFFRSEQAKEHFQVRF